MSNNIGTTANDPINSEQEETELKNNPQAKADSDDPKAEGKKEKKLCCEETIKPPLGRTYTGG